MADLKRDIRYIDRDFNQFRNALINYSKTYFPDTYNDFTDTSTGMLFMEMASYVGDVLSFYLDNQIQETFIQKARQQENLYQMAYLLGYEPKVTTAASVDIDFYQQVPAKLSGSEYVPDYDYAMIIPENTQITSNVDSTQQFLIEDVIDFSASGSLDPTTVSVYQISGANPTYYLLKKTRKAISATINSIDFTFTAAERFDTRTINASNIIGILDCKDTDDNEWYEVPNMAQENVFDTIRNTNTNDPTFNIEEDAPYLLQLKQVQRRFVTRFIDSGSLQIQFGAGSTKNNDETIVPNPDNVGLGLPFERDQLTTAFSPLNFIFTNTYGIAPYNTTLTFRYLTGGGVSSNVEAGTLTVLDDTNFTFVNPNLSDTALANQIFASVSANNALAADGGQDGDTIEELRLNAVGNFQNQLRAVTKEDYLIRTLSMPSNLGTIAKAYAAPTKIAEYQPGELPTILDLYVLTYDADKKLRTASSLIKRNLRTYLAEYRMINDSIKIKDAFVINIEVVFDIIVLPNYNNSEVLTKCIDSLSNFFDIDDWQINQPILFSDLYVLLDKVEGVQTVKKIQINNLTGEALGYSSFAYDIPGATIDDVVYPSIDPMIFEVKFPNSDIKGRVVPI
ncbi:MAG: hypothetical protein CMD25_00890 [Flavobacteriales bacterium]|jgi:hypothetical protein|nr:hypothetical protein [Flavobacteriales bacterium]|tara:strand:- start:965 stop:2827 length:1863 start_codon:yes stop_codon:yes gene_type:complete